MADITPLTHPLGRPYGKYLKRANYSMTLRGVTTSARKLYDNLIQSINNVFWDVTGTGSIDPWLHPAEYRLFRNPYEAIDGPW
jgi:hypothetical protein